MSWIGRIPAPRSFGGKMMVVIVLAAAVAATLACGTLVPIHYHRSRVLALEDLATLSRVIAIHSTAAMDFGDPATGAETLRALRAEPQVVAAAMFRPDGEVFASYRRPGRVAPPLRPQAVAQREEGPWMFHRALIVRDDTVLGSVVLAYDTRPITARLWRDAGLAVLAALGSTVVAGVLAYRLQRVLAEPIAEISHTAARVAESNNYTIRARRFADDELGRLTDAFNGMLARIDQQNREIQRSNAELHARNHEMEQFVYTVSHDLKSPLVTISGFVGLLEEDIAAGNTEGIHESTEHLKRASAKMSELIDDLLRLSRIGRAAMNYGWVDANAIVDEVVDEMQGRLEQAGAVVDVQPDLPAAWSDRTYIAQVFDNLLTNAVKYGCPAPGCRIAVGGEQRGGEVRYFVRDQGPGIEPQYHERVFGLFHRLDNQAEGTGVGLAIVARIAELHGGRAWVESAPGRGATFWFSLAASPNPHEPASPPPESENRAERKD